MAREYRQIVSLDEILALRWECPKCHLAMAFSLNKTPSLPTSCPVCNVDAVEPRLKREHRVYSEFIETLRAVIEHQQSHAASVGTVRLELPAQSARVAKGGA